MRKVLICVTNASFKITEQLCGYYRVEPLFWLLQVNEGYLTKLGLSVLNDWSSNNFIHG